MTEDRRGSRAWVRVPEAQTDSVRLFCFPFAGSGASVYQPWAAELPDRIQICPVQLPGREWRMREQPYTKIEPLIRTLTEVLAEHMDGQFALFGHSMGALIAYELAHALREAGLKPLRLLVSGYRAPHLPSQERTIHNVPDAMFVSELRRLRGTPEEVLRNKELMDLVTPVLRADFELAETYTWTDRTPLDIPISAFGGISDRVTKREWLQEWEAHTSADFTLRMVPGSHFFLQESRKVLLRAIAQDLV